MNTSQKEELENRIRECLTVTIFREKPSIEEQVNRLSKLFRLELEIASLNANKEI